jgi:hypothetical protein
MDQVILDSTIIEYKFLIVVFWLQERIGRAGILCVVFP